MAGVVNERPARSRDDGPLRGPAGAVPAQLPRAVLAAVGEIRVPKSAPLSPAGKRANQRSLAVEGPGGTVGSGRGAVALSGGCVRQTRLVHGLIVSGSAEVSRSTSSLRASRLISLL